MHDLHLLLVAHQQVKTKAIASRAGKKDQPQYTPYWWCKLYSYVEYKHKTQGFTHISLEICYKENPVGGIVKRSLGRPQSFLRTKYNTRRQFWYIYIFFNVGRYKVVAYC